MGEEQGSCIVSELSGENGHFRGWSGYAQEL